VELGEIITMTETVIIAVLILIIAFQAAFYSFQINKLLNKLMSRNYFEYEQANKPQDVKVQLPKPDEVPEDLRVLQGFELS
jgi:hypothetical protein